MQSSPQTCPSTPSPRQAHPSRPVLPPVGSSMNSCMASLLPAWLPPLITLKQGTGRMTFLLPARSAMWRYSGTP